MNSDAKQKLGMLSGREEKLWDFFISVGVMSADELQKELELNELIFQHLSPNLNREPKKYFLYRVLDEIQKAALKIDEWKKCLSEADTAKLQRIDYETVIDGPR